MDQNALSVNPEEKVEVLPSLPRDLNRKPKTKNYSWVLISVSLIIIGASISFMLSQIQNKFPGFRGGILFKFPARIHLSSTIAVKSVIKPPVSVMGTVKSLAQVTIPAPQSTNAKSSKSLPGSIVLDVQGVMADGNHNVALINGNIYEEGSIINGIKIIKINLNALTIERDGQQETIAVRK